LTFLRCIALLYFAIRLESRKSANKRIYLPRRRHQFPSYQLAVGSVQVTQAASVRDLGVYLDSNMSVRSQVTRLVCTCFGILRQICSIRRSVPRSKLSTLISSFVVSKLDYCNVALAGLSSCDCSLQSVIIIIITWFWQVVAHWTLPQSSLVAHSWLLIRSRRAFVRLLSALLSGDWPQSAPTVLASVS